MVYQHIKHANPNTYLKTDLEPTFFYNIKANYLIFNIVFVICLLLSFLLIFKKVGCLKYI